MEWNGIWFNSYASNRNKTLVGQYYLWWNTAVPQIPYFTTAVALIPDLQSFCGRLETVVEPLSTHIKLSSKQGQISEAEHSLRMALPYENPTNASKLTIFVDVSFLHLNKTFSLIPSQLLGSKRHIELPEAFWPLNKTCSLHKYSSRCLRLLPRNK